MKGRHTIACAVLAAAMATGIVHAQNAPAGPPATARAAAPIDLTGQWVAFVTEDWRFRMMTPPKGDYEGLRLRPEARKIADAWTPGADTGDAQCKPYGAAAIMRVPGRLRIDWQDENTLRVETDAGMQTRTFRFGGGGAAAGAPTWQGMSSARWDLPARALTVVTTRLRPGYLRRNGVPYSDQAVVTEHFDVAPHPDGGQLLIVTTVVDDPRYLAAPYVVSSQFKKETDRARWNPTPCSAAW